MDAYASPDYYALDSLLSDQEKAVRARARAFVDQEVKPIIEAHHRAATSPLHLARRMGELGFFAPHLQGHGCAGLNNICYGLIMQELDRGDAGLRSLASVQGALAMYAIHAYGDEDQKQRWLPGLASGERLACFALTERDHGSDPASMETTARRDGDHYLLNGNKRWIGNGDIADVKVIWARDEHGEVGAFIVEQGAPGFRGELIEGKFSLRTSRTTQLYFDNCRIPAANRLPGAKGLRAPLSCLSQARYGIAWGAIGTASECYHVALQYARNRRQFGKPIAAFQLVQEKLVWMLNEITKAQLLALQLGRLKDAGTARPQQISLAKRNNVWMALECARKARDILGGVGITDEYPVIRHLMNLETVYTYEGTHDIHTLILGQDITGCNAFGNA
jgi:glutaryl-CoA dehydrogenase